MILHTRIIYVTCISCQKMLFSSMLVILYTCSFESNIFVITGYCSFCNQCVLELKGGKRLKLI